MECRGADNANELDRQQKKIVAALADIDADVVGLIELENNVAAGPAGDGVDPVLETLVVALNAEVGAGTYAFIDAGIVGTDAIKQAFIYKPATVTPVGDPALLDTPAFMDPTSSGVDRNRPAVAQTFVDNDGGVFTVVVNHLKSKGSGCGAGDDDPEQGSCNLTRTLSAQELLKWLATDPTGSGDADVLIIGDLNSYDKEDPIGALEDGGYTDLLAQFGGEFAYSYVFDGQLGYLDYGMANGSLLPQVTGTAAWHNNADEPDILDYDTSFKQPAQQALFEENGFRASDHDPVVVGLNPAHFDFTGFFRPVKNPPDFNSMKSGSSVPVKFSLDGNQGLDIFLSGYPVSQQVDCSTLAPSGNAEQTVTAGGSSLTYDVREDQYIYPWMTDKSWAGTCRQLVVILTDGSIHTANFSFK